MNQTELENYYSNDEVVLIAPKAEQCKSLTQSSELEYYFTYGPSKILKTSINELNCLTKYYPDTSNTVKTDINGVNFFTEMGTLNNQHDKVNFFTEMGTLNNQHDKLHLDIKKNSNIISFSLTLKDIRKIRIHNMHERCHISYCGTNIGSSTKVLEDQVFDIETIISKNDCPYEYTRINLPKIYSMKFVTIDYQKNDSDEWIDYLDSRMGKILCVDSCTDLITIGLPSIKREMEYQIRLNGIKLWQGKISLHTSNIALRLIDPDGIFIGAQNIYFDHKFSMNLSRVDSFEFIPIVTEDDFTNDKVYDFNIESWYYNIIRGYKHSRGYAYTNNKAHNIIK